MAKSQTLVANPSLFRVMDAIPDGVLLRAADGTVLDVNRGFCRITGFEREELVGQSPPNSFWPEERAEEMLQICRECLASPGGHYELTLKRKNGERFPAAMSTAALRGEWGMGGRCIVTVRDMTRQRLAERGGREAESRLRAVVESALDAIVVIDASGRIVEFSESAERTFGLGRQQALGREMGQTLIPPQFRERYQLGLARYLETGHTVMLNRRSEITAQRADGSEFPIELTVTRADVDGSALFTAFVRDLSERRSHEDALKAHVAQLAALTEQLQKKNEELDQFAYVTSHDLKAPLRGIANLSTWIEEDLGDRLTHEAREQMELLRGRVRRMEALIEGILQLSRVGRSRANPERIEVSALLRDVVDLIHPPEGFSVEVPKDAPVINAERLRLEQVFINLIGNAIKHHGVTRTGRVWIECRDRGPQWLEFSVSDDGPGIAPQYHQKIFAVFQTLAARDCVEGTGLGLSLVRKIVENEGGVVSVESAEGCGATFRFTWPREPRLPAASTGKEHK